MSDVRSGSQALRECGPAAGRHSRTALGNGTRGRSETRRRDTHMATPGHPPPRSSVSACRLPPRRRGTLSPEGRETRPGTDRESPRGFGQLVALPSGPDGKGGIAEVRSSQELSSCACCTRGSWSTEWWGDPPGGLMLGQDENLGCDPDPLCHGTHPPTGASVLGAVFLTPRSWFPKTTS